MREKVLAQNCQKFDNFNFEFSMSHHNAHYQSYKNAPTISKYSEKWKIRKMRGEGWDFLTDFTLVLAALWWCTSDPLCQIPNWVSHFFNWLTLKLQDLQLVILSRRALTRMMMTASMLIYRRLWWRSEQVGNMLDRCILSVPAELAFYDAPHHPPFYFVIQQFAQLTYNYDFLAAGQGWY